MVPTASREVFGKEELLRCGMFRVPGDFLGKSCYLPWHHCHTFLRLILPCSSLQSSFPSSKQVHGTRRVGQWHRARRHHRAFLLPQGRPCSDICCGLSLRGVLPRRRILAPTLLFGPCGTLPQVWFLPRHRTHLALREMFVVRAFGSVKYESPFYQHAAEWRNLPGVAHRGIHVVLPNV